MMNNNSIVDRRRKFLKGFGVLGALAAGAAATTVVIEKHTETKLIPAKIPKVDPNMVALIEEQTPSILTLTSKYGTVAPPPREPMERMRFNSDGTYSINPSLVSSLSPPYAGLTIQPNGSLHVRGNSTDFVPGTENSVAVKLVAGPDGELYLNVNGEWKRVLTT